MHAIEHHDFIDKFLHNPDDYTLNAEQGFWLVLLFLAHNYSASVSQLGPYAATRAVQELKQNTRTLIRYIVVHILAFGITHHLHDYLIIHYGKILNPSYTMVPELQPPDMTTLYTIQRSLDHFPRQNEAIPVFYSAPSPDHTDDAPPPL